MKTRMCLVGFLFTVSITLLLMVAKPSSAPAAVSLDLELRAAPEDQENPAVASAGVNFLVVWMDRRNKISSWTDYDIYAARISAAGEVLDPGGIPVCTATNWQSYPSVAFDGVNYLVVWSDNRNHTPTRGALDVYGARVSPAGEVQDPNGFQITHGEAIYQPTLAFNGTEYLVTGYVDGHNGVRATTVLGVRVTPDAVVRDTEELVIHQSTFPTFAAGVASVGSDWLVVWNDVGGIQGARVSRDGSIFPPVMLKSGPSFARGVRGLAPVGDNYFLTSIANRLIGTDTYVQDVYGTWISPAGEPLRTILVASNQNQTIGGTALLPTTYLQENPTAAANGSELLVVWESGIHTDGARYRYLSDIRGVRIDANGNVSPSFSLCIAPQDQSQPTVAFNGRNFMAVWHDARTAPPEQWSAFGQFDVYGARVDTTGTVLEPNGFLISGFVPDADGDGVPDNLDQCPGTEPGAIVDAQGCSIAQLCPCDAPWRNHAEYIGCVVGQSSDFLRQGLITEDQRRATTHDAILSGCGKRRRF